MAHLSMVLFGVILVTLTSQLIDAARRSNCGFGASECDKCGSNSKTITKNNIKVCCPNCGSRFLAFPLKFFGIEKPYCSCYDPEIVASEISGDCWKTSQCDACTNRKHLTWSGAKFCCANCENSGVVFHLWDKTCYCRHHPKDKIKL